MFVHHAIYETFFGHHGHFCILFAQLCCLLMYQTNKIIVVFKSYFIFLIHGLQAALIQQLFCSTRTIQYCTL